MPESRHWRNRFCWVLLWDWGDYLAAVDDNLQFLPAKRQQHRVQRCFSPLETSPIQRKGILRKLPLQVGGAPCRNAHCADVRTQVWASEPRGKMISIMAGVIQVLERQGKWIPGAGWLAGPPSLTGKLLANEKSCLKKVVGGSWGMTAKAVLWFPHEWTQLHALAHPKAYMHPHKYCFLG